MRLFSVLLVFIVTVGFGQDTVTVERLDYQFIKYLDGQILPLTSLENEELAGVLLPCTSDLQLEICGTSPVSVWADGRWVAAKPDAACTYLSIKRLCEYADRDTIFLSLAASHYLGDIQVRTFEITQEKPRGFQLMAKVRRPGVFQWGSLLCVFLLVVLWLLKPYTTRLLRPNFESQHYRFFTVDNIIVLFTGAILNIYALLYLSKTITLGVFFELAFLVLSAWIVKLLAVLVSSMIFQLKREASWQLNVWAQGWSVICVVFFGFIFFDELFFDGLILTSRFYSGLAVFFTVLLSGVVAYNLMVRRGSKSLHIFIYLCTTEFLPALLVLFLILK